MPRKGRKIPEHEAISRSCKAAVTLLRRTPSARGMMNNAMLIARARGHIARVATLTGDNPVGVMVHIGLTDAEMLRIGDFKRTVVWS